MRSSPGHSQSGMRRDGVVLETFDAIHKDAASAAAGETIPGVRPRSQSSPDDDLEI